MEKRGLGRGLAALIPDADLTKEEGHIREISINAISPNPYQPRTTFDPEKMLELVDSVREHGILQPLLVRQTGSEHYELVAGERRFRAARAAGLATIPVLVRDLTEREQLEIAIVENLQREDIGPVETARAFQRLKDEFGMTQEAIAQRTGKSRPSIANLLRLLVLPEEILQSLEEDKITEGHARSLLILTEDWRQLALWKEILEGDINVRESEKRARKIQDEVDRAGAFPPASRPAAPATNNGRMTARTTDPNQAEVESRLQHILGTKVVFKRNAGGGGHIEIEFYSPDELERLIEVLSSLKPEIHSW